MKRHLIHLLLKILNSYFLNPTPCKYGFIGNVDAFSFENLASEEKQQPGITVREVLEMAERFKACPLTPRGLMVIEGDETREATIWDVHELNQSLRK